MGPGGLCMVSRGSYIGLGRFPVQFEGALCSLGSLYGLRGSLCGLGVPVQFQGVPVLFGVPIRFGGRGVPVQFRAFLCS